jgi:nicotinate-nucleotide adenylyltransferase
VLGGAFDPPHLAHISLGQAALAQLKLDVLVVVPTGQTLRKSHALSAAHHRLGMTRLAFAGDKRVRVDECEIQRSSLSYTIDTLHHLSAEMGPAHFFLIIGEDQASSFTTWHKWQEILEMSTLAVAHRSLDPTPQSLDSGLLGGACATPALELTQYQWHNWATHQRAQHSAGDVQREIAVQLLMPSMALSATHIRHCIQNGSDISGCVTPSVMSYIQSHSLYTDKAT